MRWICPKCGRSLSLAAEDCPYCKTEEANQPPTQPPSKPGGPVRVHYGLPGISRARLRRGLDYLVAVLLVIVTILFILAWGWPEKIPW